MRKTISICSSLCLAILLTSEFTLDLVGLTSSAGHAWAQEVGLDDGENIPLWNVNLGADINYASGNFDQLRASGRGVIFKRWGDRVALLNRVRYQYMKNGDIKFSDDFRDALVVNLNPLDAFQPFAIALYHKSFTRFIDRRWMAGLGGAYSLQRTRKGQIKVGVGAAYEWTRLDGRPPPFSPPDGYGGGCLYESDPTTPRDCGREMWRVIPRIITHHELSDGHLIIDGEALWVVDPQNLDDERIFFSLTAAVPVLSWLRLYTHYDLSFESIILKHRQQLDSHLSFGFQVTSIGQASRPNQTPKSDVKQ